MAKHCETFEHTADIGLAASADTLGELFEALGEGLAEIICPIRQARARQRRRIAVRAEDVEGLTVDFLAKIMVTIQTDGFVVAAVRVGSITENEVIGHLAGEPFDPARHEFHTEVKAVTYHQLRVARDGEKWTARVILDI